MTLTAYVLLNSFACLGLHVSASEGMILNRIKNCLELNLSEWLFKPLIGCPSCMGSIWGIVGFVGALCFNLVDIHQIALIIPYVCVVCFLNTLFYYLLQLVIELHKEKVISNIILESRLNKLDNG